MSAQLQRGNAKLAQDLSSLPLSLLLVSSSLLAPPSIPLPPFPPLNSSVHSARLHTHTNQQPTPASIRGPHSLEIQTPNPETPLTTATGPPCLKSEHICLNRGFSSSGSFLYRACGSACVCVRRREVSGRTWARRIGEGNGRGQSGIGETRRGEERRGEERGMLLGVLSGCEVQEAVAAQKQGGGGHRIIALRHLQGRAGL
jgi:hypothetical protein